MRVADSRTPSHPDLDRALELLSHRYRRWLLSYMVKFEKQTIPLSTAVKVIAHLEPWSSPDATYQALKHTHLRRLDSAGLIQFDSRAETITLTDDPFVNSLIRETTSWESHFSD